MKFNNRLAYCSHDQHRCISVLDNLVIEFCSFTTLTLHKWNFELQSYERNFTQFKQPLNKSELTTQCFLWVGELCNSAVMNQKSWGHTQCYLSFSTSYLTKYLDQSSWTLVLLNQLMWAFCVVKRINKHIHVHKYLFYELWLIMQSSSSLTQLYIAKFVVVYWQLWWTANFLKADIIYMTLICLPVSRSKLVV